MFPLKAQFTNITNEDQFTGHAEYNSCYKNSCAIAKSES